MSMVSKRRISILVSAVFLPSKVTDPREKKRVGGDLSVCQLNLVTFSLNQAPKSNCRNHTLVNREAGSAIDQNGAAVPTGSSYLEQGTTA